MAVRISVTSKNKKLSGLKMLQERLTEGAVETLLGVAKHALEAATEHTPKWSGNATEGWRITLTPRSGYTDNTKYMMGSVEFPEGIYDVAADELNRLVVEREMDFLRGALKAQMHKGKFSFYLVNDVAYSAQWLNSNDAGSFLREVNQDYYTIRDIQASVQQYRLGMRLGGWV